MDQLEIYWRPRRKNQVLPELNNYPETPAVANLYPGWLSSLTPTKNLTNRRIQSLPAVDVFPETPPYTSWITHFEKTKNATNRRLQTNPELNNYPAIPVGYYPGSSLAKSNRYQFKRRLLAIPDHNVFPSAAAQGQPVTSWKPVFNRTENNTNHRLQGIEHNNYPETPAGYYSGYYPGSKLALSNQIADKRKHQDLPELNVYPATQAPDQPLTAWAVHFEPIKNATNRKLLSVLVLNQYPATPAVVPPLPAYYNRPTLKHTSKYKRIDVPEHNVYPVFAPFTSYLERPVFKHKSKYKLREVPEHNEYPATPAGYYSGYYPGSGLATSIKINFKIDHKTVSELNVYPATPTLTEPVVSWQVHFEKIRNNTNRKILNVKLDRYPPPLVVPGVPNYGVNAILNGKAYGILASLDAGGFGITGSLDANNYGITAILNNKSFGVTATIDSDAFGVIGVLGN